jgi:O-antigen/teichoic acid export membrane protein
MPEDSRLGYFKNVAANLAGRYGSKALELLLLMVATRKLPIDVIGAIFLADAAAAVAYGALDFGWYPVLMRRAARGRASRALLARTTWVRAVGAAAIALVFLCVMLLAFPEHALLTGAFFAVGGLYSIHEPARALLAGSERFDLIAKVGLSTKLAEAICTAPAMWAGLGVVPWIIGRSVSQLGFLLSSYRLALRELTDSTGDDGERMAPLLREGWPFWFSSVLYSLSARLDSLLVSAWLGLKETGHLGIASRIVGGGLGLVGSFASVAFPDLARDERRLVTAAQVRGSLLLAFGVGLAILLGAPLLSRIVMGRTDEEVVSLVRALSPVLVIAALVRLLETWLQAKNKERTLTLVAILSFAVSATSLALLVPRWGLDGAAWSRVVRVGAELGALALIVTLALWGAPKPRAPRSP